jgi:hypothetical protein
MNVKTHYRVRPLKQTIVWLSFCGLLTMTICWPVRIWSQELDTEFIPPRANTGELKPIEDLSGQGMTTETKTLPVMRAPLTATVSKTLYLPPALYGQWSVTGTLLETNVPDTYPVSNNIWILERIEDRVFISNPENGASASIDVKAAQGNTATFLKRNELGRVVVSETVTLTVEGDHFSGQNRSKREYFKEGKLTKTQYALFRLNGTRISGARTRFRPEAVEEGPDLQIEDVQR